MRFPGNLLIILYQLTNFETPSYNNFRDIMITNVQYHDYKCSKSKSAKGNYKKHPIFNFLPGNVLIILYQLLLAIIVFDIS